MSEANGCKYDFRLAVSVWSPKGGGGGRLGWQEVAPVAFRGLEAQSSLSQLLRAD